MKGYLLDTHIWLWHVTKDPSIPAEVRDLIRTDPGSCWLSPISVWEAAMLAQRRRIEIEGDFRNWFGESRKTLQLREARLSTEIVLKSREIDLPQQDPADKFLAATALEFDLALVTMDRRLREAPWLPTFPE